GLPGHLLRREIAELALQAARLGRPRRLFDARDAEVAEFYVTRDRQVDVRRRDVPMHDVERHPGFVERAVNRRERREHTPSHVHRETGWDAALLGLATAQEPIEVDALDVLH